MSKATENDLSELHGEIARGLTRIVRGKEVVDQETGSVIVEEAPASYFMAGIAFLAKNNITADPSTNKDLQTFTDTLAQKRKDRKARLSKADIDKAAEEFDKQLGDFMQ